MGGAISIKGAKGVSAPFRPKIIQIKNGLLYRQTPIPQGTPCLSFARGISSLIGRLLSRDANMNYFVNRASKRLQKGKSEAYNENRRLPILFLSAKE
jgi:hypothetical protein